ncbi:MAG: sigma-70 family polymerase sigma factor [Flaviaesturariibacter sp.]|nr:sigma-70 family polymerase sigma factor [Flaviaesturariibacter sp.]
MSKVMETIRMDSDDVIIEKICGGDTPLFEILIRRYNPVLYRIARGYGFNHQDAEDLMQETHVAAFLDLRKFEGRASYKTWVSRIMINKCLYKLKYGSYKREVPHDAVDEEAAASAAAHFEADKTLTRELGHILERSIGAIPLPYRTVFVLRVVEGFSVAETAALLQITPVNVKVRLNRAKALLQKKIEASYSQADLYSFHLSYCDGLVRRVFESIRDQHPA